MRLRAILRRMSPCTFTITAAVSARAIVALPPPALAPSSPRLVPPSSSAGYSSSTASKPSTCQLRLRTARPLGVSSLRCCPDVQLCVFDVLASDLFERELRDFIFAAPDLLGTCCFCCFCCCPSSTCCPTLSKSRPSICQLRLRTARSLGLRRCGRVCACCFATKSAVPLPRCPEVQLFVFGAVASDFFELQLCDLSAAAPDLPGPIT